jgi:hypothetical protein
MGEKTHLPQENGLSKEKGEKADEEMHSEPEEGDDLEDMSPEGKVRLSCLPRRN